MTRRLPLMVLGAALIANRAAAADPADWFRAIQYTSRPNLVLRGCSECQGEPDDVCEVRKGAQVQALEQYARQRWPAPGRMKLLRSRADPDCAVPATGPKGPNCAGLPTTPTSVCRCSTAPARMKRTATPPCLCGVWQRRSAALRCLLPGRRADRMA